MAGFLFAIEFNVSRIFAYNIGPRQIEIAQNNLRQMPQDVRIRVSFEVADAVSLPRKECSANKVLSLESAFHFSCASPVQLDQKNGREQRVCKAKATRWVRWAALFKRDDHLPAASCSSSPPSHAWATRDAGVVPFMKR